MRFLCVIAVMIASVGCTDEAATRRTLENEGYTDIQVTGYSWWERGEDDTFHTAFTAKNPRGNVVSGTVCCGAWTKGCTVRW